MKIFGCKLIKTTDPDDMKIFQRNKIIFCLMVRSLQHSSMSSVGKIDGSATDFKNLNKYLGVGRCDGVCD